MKPEKFLKVEFQRPVILAGHGSQSLTAGLNGVKAMQLVDAHAVRIETNAGVFYVPWSFVCSATPLPEPKKTKNEDKS